MAVYTSLDKRPCFTDGFLASWSICRKLLIRTLLVGMVIGTLPEKISRLSPAKLMKKIENIRKLMKK
jgi:hypothetical protein